MAMTRLRPCLCGLLVLVAVLVSRSARAAPDPTAFDRQIDADLRAKSPEAADLFAEANAARDKDDLATAARLYPKVLEKVPTFFHAKRRLCGVEARRGNRTEALRLCREALRAEDSAENRGALAVALAVVGNGVTISESDAKEAVLHATRATELKPSDAFTWSTLCQVGLAVGDVAAFRRGLSRLKTIVPDEPSTDVLVAIDCAMNGDKGDARAALGRARAHGLPQAEYDRLTSKIDDLDARPPVVRWLVRGAKALAIWLAGFALLLLLGATLSRATLRAVDRVPSEPGGHPRGADATLRKIYRAVLWVCCAYYYLSLPVVALGTLALGGGAILAVLAMGYVSIKLFLVVAIVVLATLYAIVKSLLVRGRDVDPGTKIDLRMHPKLDVALAEVAARVGTRRVDNVYFTPGTDIAVTERGGLLRQLRRKSERALILGAGVLDGMTVRQLKSILAHEYGHFHNEDTAGGGFSLSVRRSLLTMAINLARGGVATWYNPAWWFVRGFYNVFLRISQGASRLQEVLADRWAAFAYGSEAFESGLRHVIARSVAFGAHADATLKEVVEAKRALPNLYTYAPEIAPVSADVAKEVAKELEREPSPYDSHPSPRDRIAWVRKLAAPGVPTAEDGESAWTLFADREAVERMMTGALRAEIRAAHGVVIAEGS